MSAILEVLDGGLQTTVQDAGRAGWAHVGVPESGPADPWGFAVANLLAGNQRDGAALEVTIAGPTLRATGPIVVGLAGADLGARIRGGRRLLPGRSVRLMGGDVLELPGGPTATPGSPARAYLAVAGGLDVPIVLGSRSTCLPGAFGGLDGRALQPGDVLGAMDRPASAGRRLDQELAWPSDPAGAGDPAAPADRVAPAPGPAILRVLAVGSGELLDAVTAGTWRVGSAADRVGLRLDGGPLPKGVGAETTTHGVVWGAIQVPPDGRPIVLGPDHQTTGGYRVAGVVIRADRPILGQLRPGAPVRLVATDHETAIQALRDQQARLAAGVATLREAAAWDALADAAGG